jgi:hypothetical protein
MSVLAAALLGAGATTYAQSKRILGVTEAVRLEPEGILIVALLDTGASRSSLDARAIRLVDRNGKAWVEFTYHDGEHVAPMARPLVRMAHVRSAPGVRETRPVVMMQLCMGGIRREAQVNLTDRSGMRPRMLIGRNFLIDAGFIVDPALNMTSTPICSEGSR